MLRRACSVQPAARCEIESPLRIPAQACRQIELATGSFFGCNPVTGTMYSNSFIQLGKKLLYASVLFPCYYICDVCCIIPR